MVGVLVVERKRVSIQSNQENGSTTEKLCQHRGWPMIEQTIALVGECSSNSLTEFSNGRRRQCRNAGIEFSAAK